MVDVTGPLNKNGSLRGRAVIVGSDRLKSVDGVRAKEFMAYGALDYDITPRTTLFLSAGYQVNPVTGFDYGVSATFDGTRLPSSFSQNFSPSWNTEYTSLQETNLDMTHRFESGWKSQTTVFYRHELSTGVTRMPGPVSPRTDCQATLLSQRNTYDWFGADTNVSGPVQLFGQTYTLTVGANYSLLSSTALSGSSELNGPFDGSFNVFDPNSVPNVNPAFSYGSNNRTDGVYAQPRFTLRSR